MLDSHRRTIRHIRDSEIAGAERFHFAVGVLVLEVAEDVPRGVHRVVPSETPDVEHLERCVRGCSELLKSGAGLPSLSAWPVIPRTGRPVRS
jgi:hypothetical protein